MSPDSLTQSAQVCRVLPDQVQMTVPRCQVETERGLDLSPMPVSAEVILPGSADSRLVVNYSTTQKPEADVLGCWLLW